MLYAVSIGLLAVTALAYAIDLVFGSYDDPREPNRATPLIPVPVIGHILGVIRYGFNYYNLLR